MDGVLRYGMFALLFTRHEAPARDQPGPELRYLYNDDNTEETVAFFYDNTFARCNECNPYSQSDIDALRSAPLSPRIGNIYKVANNQICTDATERFPLPIISQKSRPEPIPIIVDLTDSDQVAASVYLSGR